MLYDPKWEKSSVAGFKAWLERQDPDARFYYGSCDKCAVGQYLAALGTNWHTAHAADGDTVDALNRFAYFAMQREGSSFPTFGAVLREIESAGVQ